MGSELPPQGSLPGHCQLATIGASPSVVVARGLSASADTRHLPPHADGALSEHPTVGRADEVAPDSEQAPDGPVDREKAPRMSARLEPPHLPTRRGPPQFVLSGRLTEQRSRRRVRHLLARPFSRELQRRRQAGEEAWWADSRSDERGRDLRPLPEAAITCSPTRREAAGSSEAFRGCRFGAPTPQRGWRAAAPLRPAGAPRGSPGDGPTGRRDRGDPALDSGRSPRSSPARGRRGSRTDRGSRPPGGPSPRGRALRCR